MMLQRFSPLARLIVLLAVLTVLPLAARAQDAKNDPKPAAAKKEAVEGAKKEKSGKPAPPPPLQIGIDPLAEVLKGLDYSKPGDVLFALDTNLKLARYDSARELLKKLSALQLNDRALAELVERFGSGIFIRLIRTTDLQPEGGVLGSAALAAWSIQARNPAQLASLAEKLKDARPEVRAEAIAQLQKGDTVAVQLLIQLLASTNDQAYAKHLQIALIAFGKPAIDPLIGAVLSGQPQLQTRAMPVLGALHATVAIPYLVRLAVAGDHGAVQQAARAALRELAGVEPTEFDSVEFLRREVESLAKGTAPARPDLNDMVTLWRWDERAKTVQSRQLPSIDASQWVAAELARDLVALRPQSPELREVFILTTLEAAKTSGGLDQPLSLAPGSLAEGVAKTGVEAIEHALATALQSGRTISAVGAAEMLGLIGNKELLVSRDGRPRVLVTALRDKNRRVQFAAASAIIKLDPQQPFAGASYLAETVGLLASSTGSRRAIIGDPRTQQVQLLVAMLNELGFDTTSASTGRDLFRQAAEASDCEFVIVSDALDHPNFSETLQQLRSDPRTAALPVGLMSREDTLDRDQQLAQADRLAVAFPRPLQIKTMAEYVGHLTDLGGRLAVSRQQRIVQGTAALQWYAMLAADSQKYGFYDLLREESKIEQALYVPELAPHAAAALGQLGSPAAQRALVNLAVQAGSNPETQRRAVASFANAVQRRGLLLSTVDISEQYERYNRSRNAPRETQQTLGSLLDVIELRYKQEHSASP